MYCSGPKLPKVTAMQSAKALAPEGVMRSTTKARIPYAVQARDCCSQLAILVRGGK